MRVANDEATLLRFKGIDEPLLLIPLQPGLPKGTDLAGSRAWAFVALENDREAEAAIRDVAAWRAGLPPNQLVHRELADFERWRAVPPAHFASAKERRLWRQSETMLRIAQSREPNRADRFGNGLIVAALPDV